MADETKFLYVWEDVFCDYTCGIAFAIASSPDEARKLIADKRVRDEPPTEKFLAMNPTLTLREYNRRRRIQIMGELGAPPKRHSLASRVAYSVSGGG